MSRRGTAGWYGMISRKMLLSQRNHKCSGNFGSGSGGLLAPITNGTAGIIIAMASDARKKCGTALTFASYDAASASSSKTASRRQLKILPRKESHPRSLDISAPCPASGRLLPAAQPLPISRSPI